MSQGPMLRSKKVRIVLWVLFFVFLALFLKEAGILFVAAAGNGGTVRPSRQRRKSTIFLPASCRRVPRIIAI